MDPASRSVAPDRRPPRRVLLASGESGLYGGERQLLLLARGLRERGTEVSLLARGDGRLLPVADEHGVPTVAFSARPSPFALWRCRRAIRRERPEVLHCNDSRALTTAGLASLGLPIRLRSAARRVCFPIRSPLAFRMLSNRMLCVSEAVRERCVEAGLEPERLYLTPDAVDVDRIESGQAERGRNSMGPGADAPIVLVPASLDPCKGHRTLLEALPAVWEQHPEATFLLAGDGTLRAELEASASRAPPGRLRVLGYREDLPDLFAAAHLVVLPSLEEGFGSAIAEASWTGSPVVASEVGGIPELLRDEGNGPAGWLVPPGRPGPLAEAIVEALSDRDEAGRRAGRARSRARSRHHPDATVDATLRAWTPAAHDAS